MKILIIGSLGKMGSALTQFLLQQGETVFGIDKEDRQIAKNLAPDVIVDFSCADSIKENLSLAMEKHVPIIVATTGHTEENLKFIKKCAKDVPILLSSNFSLQFNVLLKMLNQLLPLKKQDFVLTEIHHKHKMDAPSGSAKTIQQKLKNLGINLTTQSIRAGEIVGTHILNVFDDYETLTLSHSALNRNTFCKGCYVCCKFLQNKQPKLYTMDDVLNESL